jgi:hypothetical protein
VSASDDDGAEELENQSVVLMTTQKLSGEFLKRYISRYQQPYCVHF